MAIQKIVGRGMFIPEVPARFTNGSYTIAFADVGPMDAAAEKIAFIGRIFHKDGGAKNLSTIAFRFGSAITKANGSTLRVSIQDISTTTADADGVAIQSCTIANADAAFAADTWYTATLGAVHAITSGEWICVVWDFNGAFQAGDSVTIAGIDGPGYPNCYADCYTRLYTAAWAIATSVPNLVLGFDDGTYGTLDGAGIFSALGELVVANDHDPDEVALKFQVPFPMTVDAIWARMELDGDASVILTYGGSTKVIACDLNNRLGTADGVFVLPLDAHVALSKDTDYYVSVRPDSATHVTVPYADVATVNHWQAYDGGANFRYTERVDAGAWDAATTTRRIFVGVRAIGFDDGAGAGGGAINLDKLGAL